MQKFEFYFNGKSYTSVSGLKSAQRAWIEKYLPGIVARLLDTPGGMYAAKIENYLPGLFRQEYQEYIKLYIRVAFIARLYFRTENRIRWDWTTKPEEGTKFAVRHAAAELINSGIRLTAEEKNDFFEWAKNMGANEAKARFHEQIAVRQVEGDEPLPARRNVPKRERRDRSADKAKAAPKKGKGKGKK